MIQGTFSKTMATQTHDRQETDKKTHDRQQTDNDYQMQRGFIKCKPQQQQEMNKITETNLSKTVSFVDLTTKDQKNKQKIYKKEISPLKNKQLQDVLDKNFDKNEFFIQKKQEMMNYLNLNLDINMPEDESIITRRPNMTQIIRANKSIINNSIINNQNLNLTQIVKYTSTKSVTSPSICLNTQQTYWKYKESKKKLGSRKNSMNVSVDHFQTKSLHTEHMTPSQLRVSPPHRAPQSSKNKIPILPQIGIKYFQNKNKKEIFKYCLTSHVFPIVRNKIEPVSIKEESDEDQIVEKKKQKIPKKALNSMQDFEHDYKYLEGINYQLYNIKLKKKEEKQFSSSEVDKYLSSDKRKGMESELDLIMDILAIKIKTDENLIDQYKRQFFTSEEAYFYLEVYVKFILSNDQINLNTNDFNYFKIPWSILAEILEFFDVAIKRKYNYSQFVVNDYLHSFKKHSKLIIISNSETELGGEVKTKALINKFLNEFIKEPQISKKGNLEKYIESFTIILHFALMNTKLISPIQKKQIKELHQPLNFSYVDFYLLKKNFWKVFENHNISESTKINILEVIELMREDIVQGAHLVWDRLLDAKFFKSLYDNFEWKLTLDQNSFDPFKDVNNIVMKIFLKGLFHDVLLNDTVTYDFKEYIENKVIVLDLESFSCIKNVLFDVLMDCAAPLYYTKNVQIRLNKFQDKYRIREKSALYCTEGPKGIYTLIDRILQSIKNREREVKISLKGKFDEEDIEKALKRISKKVDSQWWQLFLSSYLSCQDCYNSQDLIAIGQIYKIRNPVYFHIIKQAIFEELVGVRDLQFIFDMIQLEIDYVFLNK